MNNGKKLRTALITSAVSLCACVALLAGSTFAWFTDSITSGNNVITAGSLDIQLYRGADKAEGTISSTTEDLFGGVDLWEPGAADYEILTVSNEGTLDLRYILQVDVTDKGTYSLSDVLQIGYVACDSDATYTRDEAISAVEGGSGFASLSDGLQINGQIEASGSDVSYLVVVYWEPSDNDNNYNVSGTNTTTFTAKLLATQLASESDGFDNTYDEDATYYDATTGFTYNNDGNVLVEEAQVLVSAVASGENVVLVDDLELSENTLTAEQYSKLDSSVDPLLNVTSDELEIDLNGNTLSVSGCCLEIANCLSLKNYSPITFKMSNGTFTSDYGNTYQAIRFDDVASVIFENVKFVYGGTGTSGGCAVYAVGYDGSNVNYYTFKNCVFDNYNLEFKGNSDTEIEYNITIEDCSFDATFGVNQGGCVVIDSYAYATLNITNTSFKLTPNSSNVYGVRLTTNTQITAISIEDVTFTGYSASYRGGTCYAKMLYSEWGESYYTLTEKGTNTYTLDGESVDCYGNALSGD